MKSNKINIHVQNKVHFYYSSLISADCDLMHDLSINKQIFCPVLSNTRSGKLFLLNILG